MNIVNIKFEVHYHDVTHTHGSEEKRKEFYSRLRSNSGLNGINLQADARYRIYVNLDLLTERVWYWGNDNYLKESVFVDLDKHTEHTVELEPLFVLDYFNYPIAIRMKNIEIPKATIINQSKNKLTFKIA